MVGTERAAPLAAGVLGGSWIWVLSALASVACSSTEEGKTPGAGGGRGGSGSGGIVGNAGSGTPNSGGASGATMNMTGGKAGMSGVAGNQPAAGSGGTGAGGAGTGGVGGGAGADAGAGRGGIGSGGVAGSLGGAGAGSAGAGSADTVTRTASTFAFRHFAIETNAAGVWNGAAVPTGQPITTTYDTVVLENGYLKVTILPDYGGRILSIVHKPTNRELLYQNPIGTPYLMQEGIFYYDYLVIMGGIFPSFPEPEHGKYWNQPYDLEVVSESAEAITIRMSRQDDLELAPGVPARYDVGRTDVLVQLDVTLRAGSSALELDTKLTNTRSSAVPSFEYWTVTTLAPGSMPGQTAIPLNTRIMAKMEQVHLLESSWMWFAEAEERVSGEVFRWNNLSRFANWDDQGTAFANPQYSANWSGLSNDDAHMAILRVSANVETPGLKLWTFGKQSLDVDIDDGEEWLRPTIEMWHGVTPEFWARGTLGANQVKTWSDRYFPAMGLQQITAASEYGAMSLAASPIDSGTALNVAATLTRPNQTFQATLRLNGTVVKEQDVVAVADGPTTVTAVVPDADAVAGAVFQAEFTQGTTSALSGQITLP